MEDYRKGGFTLPGEAGYEALTLKMAEKWGADVIRDSDGTKLSPEIINAFKIKDIRKKLFYTLLILVVIRIGSQIPIPGIDGAYVQEIMKSLLGEGGGWHP